MHLQKTTSQRALIVLFSFIFLLSCTVTTTSPKQPVFAISTDSVDAHIQSLITAEEINIMGSQMKTNGQVTNDLTISFLNAKNSPEDEAGRKELMEQVAKFLKHSLKDPNEYDTYQVIFVTQHSSGIVSKSSTSGHVYRAEEL